MKHVFLPVLPGVVLWLAVSTRVGSPAPEDELAAIRAQLESVNDQWDRARTEFDAAAFERMLAPDFWVQIGPERLTRAQFLQEISNRRAGLALTRFESELLTLAPEANPDAQDWSAVIEEKLEFESRQPNGETTTVYSLWVTRDRFRKDGERWLTLSSEAIGWQTWSGGDVPPFDDWE